MNHRFALALQRTITAFGIALPSPFVRRPKNRACGVWASAPVSIIAPDNNATNNTAATRPENRGCSENVFTIVILSSNSERHWRDDQR
jgi:hypothetical protein